MEINKSKKGDKKTKGMNVETTTLNEVGPDERKSWLDVAFIQMGLTICVPSLMLGGMLVEGMGLRDAIISGTIGYVIVCLVESWIGIMGEDLHRPTAVVGKSGFGSVGARYILATIFSVSQFGWFAVQNVVCGKSFSQMMDTVFHISFPVTLSIAIWGLIMLATAVKGIDGLKILNQACMPALFIVFIVGMILAIKKFGTEGLSDPPTGDSMNFVEGVILTISFLSCGMTVSPDVTRYQKTRNGVYASTYGGLFTAGVALLIIGAVLAKVTSEYDISIVLVKAGVGVLGMIILILATWTTNTNNAYCAGLSIVMLLNLREDQRAIATAIAGVLGTVLAIMGLSDYIDQFVNLLGVFYFPVAAVMLVDYWILRKGDLNRWGFSKVNWAGVISWAIGCIVSYFVTNGLVWGFLIPAVLYPILYRFIPHSDEISDVSPELIAEFNEIHGNKREAVPSQAE